ncbi:hypothetical protein CL632_03280 [bacterium]|jgi:hypothetical protein|nr:hypothetical protein [bacterium]MDP6571608.1 hypothetical protein [Patescibacteria group bacterium]MDP6756588.1 hypothetical protein [Patescibacteria group bacterium]|tara:strand:+ start:22573 stop:23517 length:945 start_codon:yes stop_codon:yes gene_type:complete
MITQLEKSIFGAIVYYDVFDYPLTLVEIQRHLLHLLPKEDIRKYSLREIQEVISQGVLLRSTIRSRNGYFYLRQKEYILDRRHARHVIAKKKYDFAHEIIQVLSRVPFVRAILACNSLAIHNTTYYSDIDLVMICKKRGAWWVRLFCLLYLRFKKLRPGMPGDNDKICLSFFVDEDNLNIGGLRMGKADIDFGYWVANFYLIYDAGGYYNKFWNANREWLKQYFPNTQKTSAHPNYVARHRPIFRIILEWLLALFTWPMQVAQLKKLPKKIMLLANKDTRVRVQDGLIKMHVNDRRIEHLQEFIQKYDKALSHI